LKKIHIETHSKRDGRAVYYDKARITVDGEEIDNLVGATVILRPGDFPIVRFDVVPENLVVDVETPDVCDATDAEVSA
jgi:hypothetical protein